MFSRSSHYTIYLQCLVYASIFKLLVAAFILSFGLNGRLQILAEGTYLKLSTYTKAGRSSLLFNGMVPLAAVYTEPLENWNYLAINAKVEPHNIFYSDRSESARKHNHQWQRIVEH